MFFSLKRTLCALFILGTLSNCIAQILFEDKNLEKVKAQKTIFNIPLKEKVSYFKDYDHDFKIIKDRNLEIAIKKQLGIKGRITIESLKTLKKIVVIGKKVRSIQGLEHAVNLEKLVLGGNLIEDLSPIEKIQNLKSLRIWYNKIKNLAPIANLTQLIELELGGNMIVDITPIKNLRNLKSLDLSSNNINSFNPLKNLKKLRWLSVEDNLIQDISFLIGLDLERLWLSKNRISNIKVIANMKNLQWLKLEANFLEEIKSLKVLEKLKILTLHNNFLQIDKESESNLIIQSLIKKGVNVFYQPQNMNSLFQKKM